MRRRKTSREEGARPQGSLRLSLCFQRLPHPNKRACEELRPLRVWQRLHLRKDALSLVSFLLEIPNQFLRNLHFLGLCIDLAMF